MYFSFYSHFNDCDVTNLTSKNLALISLRLLLKSPGHAYPKSHIQNILWKKCQSRRIFLIKFDWINITIEICRSLEKLTIYRSFCFYYFRQLNRMIPSTNFSLTQKCQLIYNRFYPSSSSSDQSLIVLWRKAYHVVDD